MKLLLIACCLLLNSCVVIYIKVEPKLPVQEQTEEEYLEGEGDLQQPTKCKI